MHHAIFMSDSSTLHTLVHSMHHYWYFSEGQKDDQEYVAQKVENSEEERNVQTDLETVKKK